MQEFTNGLKALAFMFGGLIGLFTDQLTGVFYVLLFVVICDYVTGVYCAIRNNKFNYKIGIDGIAKKIFIFIIVSIGIIIDVKILEKGAILQTSFSMFYIANELISIVENAETTGLKIPKKLKKFIEEIRKEDEEV